MAGINRRHKNPIHDPSTSRASNFGKVRGSIRSLQKQAFPPRVSRARGGTRRVMGRVIGGSTSSRGGAMSRPVMNELRGEHTRWPVSASNQESSTTSPNATSNTKPKITGHLTIADLLSEENLAGLPDKYRHLQKGEHDQTLNEMQDEEEDMDICSGEDDARSVGSDDPLLLYPTRGKTKVPESEVEESAPQESHPLQPSPTTAANTPLREVSPPAITETPPRHSPVAPFPTRSSSETAWHEAGTLSSLAEHYDTDFDAQRTGMSDAGDDELIDSSDGGDGGMGCEVTGELEAGHIQSSTATGPEAGTQFFNSEVETQAERPPRLPHAEEVSRFFSIPSQTRPPLVTNGASLPPLPETVANDSAIGSWPTSTVAGSIHDPKTAIRKGTAGCRDATETIRGVRDDFGSARMEMEGVSVEMGIEGCEHGGKHDPTGMQLHKVDLQSFGETVQHLVPTSRVEDQYCAARTLSNTIAFSGTFDGQPMHPGVHELMKLLSKPAQRTVVKVSARTRFDLSTRWTKLHIDGVLKGLHEQEPLQTRFPDSPDSASKQASEPDFKILDELPDDYAQSVVRSAAQYGGGFISAWSVNVEQPGPTVSEEEDGYQRWLRGQPHPTYGPRWDCASQKSFGSEPMLDSDVERAAMEEVPDDRTEVDSGSDEDGEASDGEVKFQHRLFANHAALQEHQFRSLWPRPAIVDQQSAMLESFRNQQDEPVHDRRRSARLSMMHNRDLHGRHPGMDRYAMMRARQEEDSSAWLFENTSMDIEVWDSPDKVEFGLELLGEDGAPYVFEPVEADPGDDHAFENGRNATARDLSGVGAGASLDAGGNPFLEMDPVAPAIPNETSTPPSVEEVVVTYNYPSTTCGIAERRGEEAFQEDDILRDVGGYLDNLSQAFAAARVGTAEIESPDTEMKDGCLE